MGCNVLENMDKVRLITFFNLSRGHLFPYACTRARFNKRMTTFYNNIII
jgi:hypothetical protein